jgi:hypothetical protein
LPAKKYLKREDVGDMVRIMSITACINCGSQDIRSGTISDGVLPGYTDGLVTYVCNNCNHRGLPIIFDSEEEYEAFLKARMDDQEDPEEE